MPVEQVCAFHQTALTETKAGQIQLHAFLATQPVVLVLLGAEQPHRAPLVFWRGPAFLNITLGCH